MTHARYGRIDQIGYLVDDLDASVARWTGMLGIGPWTLFRNARLEGTYRGEETVVTMDVALAYQDSMQIELIEVTNDTPSPYRRRAGEPILGIHHVAWLVDDLDAAVARGMADGMGMVYRAGNPATRVAYMEHPGEPGLLFEFIEGRDMRAMIAAGIAATRDWDGSDPVHEIDLAKA